MKKLYWIAPLSFVTLLALVWGASVVHASDQLVKSMPYLFAGMPPLEDADGNTYTDPIAWAEATEPALVPVIEASRDDVDAALDLAEANPMDAEAAYERDRRGESPYERKLWNTTIGFSSGPICFMEAKAPLPWDRPEARDYCADVAAGERDDTERFVWRAVGRQFRDSCLEHFDPVAQSDDYVFSLTRALLLDEDWAPDDENWVKARSHITTVETRVDEATTLTACRPFLKRHAAELAELAELAPPTTSTK